MRNEIVFLTPDSGTGQRALRIAGELDLTHRFSVLSGRLEKTIEQAEALAADAEVFIARGLTAETLLRSPVETPVVEVLVSGQDLAITLEEAKRLTGLRRPRIALLAFASIHRDLEVLARLLDIDLHIYEVMNDRRHIEAQIRQAKAEGAHIAVTGTFTADIARQCGLIHLTLESGDVSLRTALLEASRLADARKLEKTRTKRFQAVMESSRDGLLVLDAKGRILDANAAVRRILRFNSSPTGLQADTFLPAAALQRCIQQGIEILDELVHLQGRSLFFSATPIRVGKEITGAVASLQPSEAISALESKIRKDLAAKGLVAQYTFDDILGASPEMRATLSLARTFAATGSTVLLVGETGTGKELFAQAIHNQSSFRQGPFVAVNCAALPPSLLESELFGYDEGAFTGARRKGKPGLFELAHEGSIFLDEISEMDHYGQTRLLRVIQERCSMRLGGSRYIPVKTRIIAASNRDLHGLVREGRFREDLFYRLNVLTLSIPPLRERSGEVPFLARHFIAQHQRLHGRGVRLSPTALERLSAHEWPGNIRELHNVLERLTLMAEGASVSAELLDRVLQPASLPRTGRYEQKSRPTAVDERQRIIEALAASGGNQQRAARSLGMHRSTLYRKIQAYGMQKTLR